MSGAVRVVFAAHGSLGDLVPFLEIGKYLVAHGHAVTVATHAAHRAAVEAAGLRHAAMRPDRPDDPAFHARFMARRSGAAFAYKSFLVPAIADSDADLMAAVEGADVLVSVTLALAAPLVAARTGIPWRSAVFQPAMLFSALDPPRLPMLPLVRGAPGWNRYVLDAARKGVESWAAPLRAYRREAGLGDYPDHPAFGGQHAPEGVLALYSPLFGALPADAPPHACQTGQVLQTGGPSLAPEIADFLAAGPPPIVFTLGSASSHVARGFFTRGAAIARRLGERALLLTGRADAGAGIEGDRTVMVAPSAPYHAVFGKARLIVHQGGLGTTALAVAAERPMLILPFAHDQIDNAARAARGGFARVAAHWQFAARGRQLVQSAMGDTILQQSVAQAGQVIRQESGTECAAAEILRAAQVPPHCRQKSRKVPL